MIILEWIGKEVEYFWEHDRAELVMAVIALVATAVLNY